MVIKVRHLFAALVVSLALVTLGTLIDTNVQAQSSGPVVNHMVGDGTGTWMLTSDNRLIYCWFPQSPTRTGVSANCRVMDQFSVNMMR